MDIKRFLSWSLLLSAALCVAPFQHLSGAGISESKLSNVRPVGFPIENSHVGRYLQHAGEDYSDGIGRDGLSVLRPYLHGIKETSGEPGWAEWGAPVAIPATKGGTIVLSMSPTFSNSRKVSVTSDSAFIYNLIPQMVYWYKVLDASGSQLSKGVVKTQGQLRMIRTEKVLNVRDIGGWPCDGGHLAYGKLFRGAAMEGVISEVGPVSETDIVELKDVVGIGIELDLRNEAMSSSPLGKDVEYRKYPIVHYFGLMNNIKPNGKIGSGDYYSKLASIFDCIISGLKANKGIYLHCTWGADRTGTLMALIEAVCGVSEADIVKDWELTSFNAVFYRKYINVQELTCTYVDDAGVSRSVPSEMRAVFQYLYDNYGGANGASVKQQVVSWLQDKVFANRADKGASVIQQLRDLLIVPNEKSPTIIKDLSKEIDAYCYSVTNDSTDFFDSESSKYIVPSTGKTDDSDAFACTGFVPCSGYNYLLLNAVTNQLGAFYDANKNYIGSLEDAAISKKYGSGAVLFENSEYAIPDNAAYVRLNMPKYCDWTAVLSVTPYLK